ncbi:flavodoxin family protein [Oceanirhabdus seepicola]|uniref:NAD(P)H-dependent oxidoreductase n=1 Tax=Oceanirhabdus seepicola TaxID=2828781 RepID=A0A9J6P334_9CLOT|nr:flavodoxin [Oceanirhabdus seepicola]MCM1990939.1 NAD(P)H-dependent oxidoreductase [Oceanirhabdus seepicola]
MKKSVVVYYSFEGSTKRLAEKLSEELNCDSLEIKVVKEITTKGFSKYIWGGRQAMMKKKPELKSYDLDLEQYDNIIIGTPVWAGTVTPPIRSFFERENIENKKIAFFCTHQGGMGKVTEKFKALVKDNNSIINSIDIVKPLKNIDSTNNEIIQWGKELKKML